MEYEDDYSEYDDYMELDEHFPSQTKDFDNRLTGGNDMTDQSKDILFQKSTFYYVMDIPRTEKYIRDMIYDLINDWGVSESFSIKLLSKFAWNQEKATRNLTEDGNFDLLDVQDHKNQNEFDCPICYSTEPIIYGSSYDCGHLYCRDCFKQYLKLAIEEGQPLKTCPQTGCKEILTPSIVERYLKTEPQIYNKYQKFLLKFVVDTSHNLLWCPAANCFNIIYLLKTNKNEKMLQNVRCDCGHCFCFQCKDSAHRPLPCEKFIKWMSLVGGKDENLNIGWIKKNAKECPSCKVSIEKNQGCMHMTCRNCKYEFCWICLGDWRNHRDCNRYESKNNSMDAESRDYEKFNFYRDRFEHQWNAIEMARKKKARILPNFKQINFQVAETKDDTFLKEACDVIVEVRRAITMTYAVGYFSHFTDLEKDMFEMQQSMLWKTLDGLDKFTDDIQNLGVMEQTFVDRIQEGSFLAGKFNTYKIALVGKVSAVTAACNKLLKYIEGELQENEAKRTIYEDDYGWYCAYCTYANRKTMKRCEMCDNVKKVLKDPTF